MKIVKVNEVVQIKVSVEEAKAILQGLIHTNAKNDILDIIEPIEKELAKILYPERFK